MKIPFGRVIIYSKRECDIFKGISQNLGNKSRGYFKGKYQTTCMSQKDPSGGKKKLGVLIICHQIEYFMENNT